MKKLYVVLFLGFLVAASMASKPLRAYVTSKALVPSGVVTLKWSSSSFPIKWQMNPVQGANVTGSRSQSEVIGASFQAWQSVVPISLQQGADTPATAKANQIDGINLITTNSAPTDLPPGVLAYTYVFFLDTGQIGEADMAFSPSYPFSTSTGSVASSVDLQSVATHEAGHFLGMDHASNVSSTMFWTTGPGFIYPRNLSADDIAGISTLYPPASFATKGTLQGTVRTTANVPVFGAIVVAVNAGGTPVASTVTDPSGGYLIQGLDPGSYTVYAEPLSGRIGPVNISTVTTTNPSATVNTNFTTRYH